MARPDRSLEIDAALLRAVAEHPKDLVGVVAAQLGLSRWRIHTQVRALLDAGFLTKQGSTRPTYVAGPNRLALLKYPREALSEDRVWFSDVAPLLQQLPRNVRDIAHYGVTEMVNNAIDHSEAEYVFVWVSLVSGNLFLAVTDDGVGIFRKITRALHLPDERLALLELSKGKLTTDATKHSGQGIFFTSRMFDRYEIHSGSLVFNHATGESQDSLSEVQRPPPEKGTMVLMQIASDSNRDSKAVFDAFSSGPDDYDFARTTVPVRLASVGDEQLVSRSQAKRLLQRVDQFRSVVFDFAEVRGIGQAFADEIFRVFASAHPHIKLIATHANGDVQQMIRRAEVLRDENADQLPLL